MWCSPRRVSSCSSRVSITFSERFADVLSASSPNFTIPSTRVEFFSPHNTSSSSSSRCWSVYNVPNPGRSDFSFISESINIIKSSVMDEEASEAAYCLLAMSRAAEREPAFSTRALGHPTVMEQQVSSSTAVDIPAALSPPETRNAAVVALESPFMIARILTDLKISSTYNPCNNHCLLNHPTSAIPVRFSHTCSFNLDLYAFSLQTFRCSEQIAPLFLSRLWEKLREKFAPQGSYENSYRYASCNKLEKCVF